MRSQRAAGGGIAVLSEMLNGLLRVNLKHLFIFLQDMTAAVGNAGNRTRYQSGAYDST